MALNSHYRIEALLSARLFLAPQLAGDRIFFVSNMSGRMSLYSMPYGGGVPQPLLPPHIALQNPDLAGGYLYYVFPKLHKILLMLDQDGNEDYRPMFVPIDGGFPEPAFPEALASFNRMHCGDCDREKSIAYLIAEVPGEAMNVAFQADLRHGELRELARSKWGAYPDGYNDEHTQVLLSEGYTFDDNVLFYWTAQKSEPRPIFGTPLEARAEGEEVRKQVIGANHFVSDDQAVLSWTNLFEDTYSPCYWRLDRPEEVKPVAIQGTVHQGRGVFGGLEHLKEDRYRLTYNIDGVSWAYEGRFDEPSLTITVEHVLCGQGELSNGVLESLYYDEDADRFILSFSTATSPTQIYTIEGHERQISRHTHERLLGIPRSLLAPGVDASFTSHDGLRVSARLYLPDKQLGHDKPYPLVYYVHGGPQSQERPDFAWFSMPLIQFLTLNGFAVFVPNVRGSSGYGMDYMQRVNRDWGGQDRLDHVHAMMCLGMDERLDTSRAAVVGRSYGGYMTLTLAARHPELWSAAVDMFGPYDLLTFIDCVPETWKPYFSLAVGDPEKDRDFLVERSPRTYIEQIQCPLLVIQGKNDPRVIERESRDVVEQLRENGKVVEYLMFEDEGHDVLKYENRVRCYNAITDFFKKHLT